ncbi:hypothetical protein CMT41_13600 [Colwellia sp. MT41]|nr:hypothetical protein CMT41_13600 [Colwellia sp. MT41]
MTSHKEKYTHTLTTFGVTALISATLRHFPLEKTQWDQVGPKYVGGNLFALISNCFKSQTVKSPTLMNRAFLIEIENVLLSHKEKYTHTLTTFGAITLRD